MKKILLITESQYEILTEEILQSELRTLNALRNMDWSINRRWVNSGVKIVDKYYDQLDQIIAKYPQLSSTIDRLKMKVDEKRKKTAQKNKQSQTFEVSDAISLFNQIYNQLEELILENSNNYIKFLEKNVERIANDYQRIMQLDRGDPEKTAFFNSKKYDSYIKNNRLWNNKKELHDYLEAQRGKYIEGEKDKLKRLIYKIKEKIGNFTNPKVSQFYSDQLIITIDTEQEKELKINMFAISAGGYNIQRFHYRWLIRFTLNGKKYEIKSTEK